MISSCDILNFLWTGVFINKYVLLCNFKNTLITIWTEQRVTKNWSFKCRWYDSAPFVICTTSLSGILAQILDGNILEPMYVSKR